MCCLLCRRIQACLVEPNSWQRQRGICQSTSDKLDRNPREEVKSKDGSRQMGAGGEAASLKWQANAERSRAFYHSKSSWEEKKS
jgi:hypothetical protein